MVVFPNAKINLGLHVLEKRPDGFHNIETVLYPIGLKDILEILPSGAGKTELHITGLPVPGDAEDNLCLKAYRMLAADHPLPPVRMHLHKVIPAGSGLGAGSSDGASALRVLNEVCGLGLTLDQLTLYAERLGSDCAFFLRNQPVYAYLRGERFVPFAADLAGFRIAVIIPPAAVPTAWAYSKVKPGSPEYPLKEIVTGCKDSWRKLLVNDFEKPVFEKYPEIGKIKKQLYDLGAAYASLSGSGSGVYGLFKETLPDLSGFGDCFTWCSD